MGITRCRWCGGERLRFQERPDTIHFGEMICAHCGKHSHWVKNPNSARTENRTNKQSIKQVCEFHKMNTEICFFCLRKAEQLGRHEKFDCDHIQELDKGGEDIIENMQVLCTSCHKLKNWARLYMNWHFNKEDEGKEDKNEEVENGDTNT